MVHLLPVSSHHTNISWLPHLADRISGHYSCLVCRARFQSIGVNCSHAVYSSNVSTSTSSVVRQLARVSLTWNGRKHLGDWPQYAASSTLAPPGPLFHRLSQQTIWFTVGPLPTLVLLNHVVVLPSRLPPNRSVSVVIVFLSTSLRDRNTFKQLMSESCCVVEFL